MLVYHSSYNSSILNYNAIKNNFNQFLNRSKIIKYHRKEEEKLCRVSINRVNIEKNISRNVLLDQSSRFTPRRNHANLEYPIEKLKDRDKKFSLVTTLLRPVSTYSEARKFRTGKRTVETLDRVLGSRDELCLRFQTRKNASWELARLSTIVQHRTISLFAVNIYIRELIKSRHARSTKSGCLVKKKKRRRKNRTNHEERRKRQSGCSRVFVFSREDWWSRSKRFSRFRFASFCQSRFVSFREMSIASVPSRDHPVFNCAKRGEKIYREIKLSNPFLPRDDHRDNN